MVRRAAAALGSVVLAAVALAVVSATAVAAQGNGAGPKAKLATLSGGDGVYIGAAIPVNLKKNGYVQYEYEATGDATSYTEEDERTADGRWTFTEDETVPYATRVLVRRPKEAAKFSGTVIVEWLNVSGGVDSDPEWATTHEELIRSGDAWVGVTTQVIGVEGGPVAVTIENVPGSEAGARASRRSTPPATARSSIRATASRSTSTRRSRAPSGPATGCTV